MIHNLEIVEKYKKFCPMTHGVCSSIYFTEKGMYIHGNVPSIYLKMFPSEFQYATYIGEEEEDIPVTFFNIKSNIIAN